MTVQEIEQIARTNACAILKSEFNKNLPLIRAGRMKVSTTYKEPLYWMVKGGSF